MHCFISVNQSSVQRSLIMILNQRNANHFIHIHKLPTTCGFWKAWDAKASWKEEGGIYTRSERFPSVGPLPHTAAIPQQISDRLSSSQESSSKRWSESQASSWSGWPVTVMTVCIHRLYDQTGETFRDTCHGSKIFLTPLNMRWADHLWINSDDDKSCLIKHDPFWKAPVDILGHMRPAQNHRSGDSGCRLGSQTACAPALARPSPLCDIRLFSLFLLQFSHL